MKKHVLKGLSNWKAKRKYELIGYFTSFLGTFLALGILLLLNYSITHFSSWDISLIIGSFGSSAITIFSEYKSQPAQPRNFIIGNFIGALVGVCVFKLLGDYELISVPLAVALTLILMKITASTHPPAGATSLIPIIGGPKIHKLGFLFVLYPVIAGSVILLLIAFIFNNSVKGRRYPQSWL
jgi:CBS domain-containing membrane protein